MQFNITYVLPPRPYKISSKFWPGLGKVIEECGELQQVCGRLISTGGEIKHWDGGDLVYELEDESADTMAAIMFMANRNNLNWDYIMLRVQEKLEAYVEWERTGQ